MGILDLVLKKEEEKKKLGSQFGGNWGLSDLLKETQKKEIVPEVKAEAKAEGGTKLEEPKKEEPNPFDTLNESILKNYKQSQSLTKKLEAYQAEYDYAPNNIKPSIAANYNKLAKENNDLVKQLQIDILKRDQMITTINKTNFMKYKQLTGLPGEAGYKTLLPEPKKPEVPSSQFGIHELNKPEQIGKVQKGVIGAFGTWEAKKRTMPELQNVEDFGNEVFKQGDERNQIAYIQEALTGIPKEETLKDLQANWDKFKNINPDIDERTWKEYYKQEGFWKTLITGPSKGKYDEAIKLRNQLIDIAQKVSEPGADIIGQLGWSGMVIMMGAQAVGAIYKGGMVVENKVIKGEKLQQAVKRIQEAYIKETGKFKSSLSQNDFRLAQSLNQTLKQYGKEIFPLQSVQVPQEVFMGQAGHITNLVKIIQNAGKLTPDIANQLKVMNPVDTALVFEELSLASPAIAAKVASQFVELMPQKITKIPKAPKAGEGMTPEELEQLERLREAKIIPKEEIEPTEAELKAIEEAPLPKEKLEVEIPKAKMLPEKGKETIRGIDFEKNPEVYQAVAKADDIIEKSKLNIKPTLPEIDIAIKELLDVMKDTTLSEKQTKVIDDAIEGISVVRKEIVSPAKPTEYTKVEVPKAKMLPEKEKPMVEPEEMEKVEKEPTPEEIKSVFMEEGNLDTTTKNREIFYEKYNDVYVETKEGYDKLIDEKVADLKEEGFKGVDRGGLKRDEEGKVIGAYPAVSENPKWYRDFYARNNKAPTNKDLKEIAIEQLSKGYTEDYGEIPANPIFNKLQAQLESYETILADVKSGNYSFETPKNIDKLNNKLNELKGENKKITKEYEIKLRNQITESNKIYGQLTEELNKQKKISTKEDIKKIKDLETEKLKTGKNIENLKAKLKEIKTKVIKPIPKSIKTKIREITGQVPQKIEIAENEILKLVLRGEAKGARKAFSEGKKAGIFTQKEKFAEVVGRAKERKAVRTEIGKIKDILQKNKLRELRPERQKAIKNIIDEMDIKKMTEKTKRKLTSRLNYIKDNPDNQIPPEKIAELERLNKKPISDFTSEDIALIKDAILHEINLNKLKNKIIFGKEIREAAGELKEARGNVLKSKKIAEDENSIDSSKAENMTILKRIKNFFNIDSFNPEVICEELDNEDHGVIMKYVFKGIDNGITDKERIKQETDIWFHEELGKIDITNWSKSFQLNKEDIDFQEVKLSDDKILKITKGERISFLLHEKNEKNLNHLLSGGFRFSDNIAYKHRINEEDLDIITNSATPEEIKVADILWKFFNEKIKPELNKTSMELNGWEIATEDNYYHIRTVALDRIRDALKAQRTFDNKTLEGMGIFKERINAKNALIIEDAFSAAFKHLEATSSYIGLAKPLRYAKLLLEDTEFQENVMKAYGKDYLKNLKRYLKEIEDDSINLDNADKLTVELINKLDSAILGLHLFVAFKQPVSYLIATTEMEAKYLQEAIYMKTDFEEISKYSPQLGQRIKGFIFRELGELGNVGKTRQFFLHKSPLNSKLLSGIQKLDSFTIGKIWNAAKLEIKDKYPDLSGEEFFNKVTERAEEVIRRTQPTWHPKDRSEVGRSKSIWMRLLTKYTSQRNKNRIALKRATLKYNRSEHTAKDKTDLLKRFATILIANGLIIEAINELRRRAYGHESRSVWQYIVASIGTTLSTFYLIGDLFSSLASKIQKGTYAGYDTGNIVSSYMDNAIDGLAELGRTLDQLKTRERYKSGSRKGDLKYKTTALRALDKNASSVLALKGIPYDNIRRLVMGIWKMAGDWGETKPTKFKKPEILKTPGIFKKPSILKKVGKPKVLTK